MASNIHIVVMAMGNRNGYSVKSQSLIVILMRIKLKFELK